MKIGVVSDTHNNLKNINEIISIFNSLNIELVIHTGDITNSNSFEQFSKLKIDLYGVYGNNDRAEKNLEIVANKNNFNFQEPPRVLSFCDKKIAIFHEPEDIPIFLKSNNDIDIVIHGHTHRYRNELINNILFFNPGESAGILKGKNAIGIIDLDHLNAKRIFF